LTVRFYRIRVVPAQSTDYHHLLVQVKRLLLLKIIIISYSYEDKHDNGTEIYQAVRFKLTHLTF